MADPAPEFDTAIETGSPATVPDNDCARLMYYLNSICNVIELKDEPNLTRLRDYKNWKSLSLAEKSELVKLCERLHPRELRDRQRVFSAGEPIKDSTNEFLTVSSKELGTDIEIMIYEDRWLKRNYLEPLKRMNAYIHEHDIRCQRVPALSLDYPQMYRQYLTSLYLLSAKWSPDLFTACRPSAPPQRLLPVLLYRLSSTPRAV